MTERVPTPSESDPREKFATKVAEHNRLRRAEEQARRNPDPNDPEALERAKARRAKFLNNLLVGGIQPFQLGYRDYNFALDVEGLKIDLGPDGNDGIHSHLPYTLISEEARAALLPSGDPAHPSHALLFGGFMNTIHDEVLERGGSTEKGDDDKAIMRHMNQYKLNELELLYRTAKSDDEREDILRKWEAQVLDYFNVLIQAADKQGGYPDLDNPDNTVDYAASGLGIDPQRIWGRFYTGKVPTTVLRAYLGREGKPHRLSIMGLLDKAELISVRGLDERISPQVDWEDFRSSHEHAKRSKWAFESRRAQVQSPQMYETIKILGVILNEFSLEQLNDMGIRVVRSSFITSSKAGRTKIDCIGFWSHFGKFQRIFINPDDHVREDGIPLEAYESIPEVSRAHFQGLEGLLAAYKALREALKKQGRLTSFRKHKLEGDQEDSKSHSEDIKQIQEFLYLVVSEIPEELYTETQAIVERLIAEITASSSDNELALLEEYEVQLEKISQYLSDVFMDEDPQAMLERALTFPNEHNKRVDFGEPFTQALHETAEKMQGNSEAPAPLSYRYDPSFTNASFTPQVFESPTEGLPYAREEQAIRTLKLERRPLLLLTCGASYQESLPEQEAVDDAYVETIFDLAIKYNANVIIPGTQATKLTMKLLEKYHDHVAKLGGTDEEREVARIAGPRFFSVEPGKDTFFPGSMHFDDDHSNQQNAHVLAPTDSILTPYRARWRDFGHDSPFRRQIHYRQSMIKRLSTGLTFASVNLNGGTWTAVENGSSAFDQAEMMFGVDMRRHSALLGCIIERNDIERLKEITDFNEFCAAIRTIVEEEELLRSDRSLVDMVNREDDHYLRETRRLIQNMQSGQGQSVTVDTFADALEDNLARQQAVIDAYDTPLVTDQEK